MDSKKIYYSLVKKNIGKNILFTILLTISCLVTVIFAYFSKLLLDHIGQDDFYIFAIILGALVIIEIALLLIIRLLYARYILKLSNQYKKEVLFNYINNDYEILDKKDSGDWLNRIISDTVVVSEAVLTYIPDFISLLVRILVSFIVLLLIDYLFALILLALGVIGFIVSTLVRRKNKTYHKKVQEQEGKNLSFYKNVLSHSFLIKLFTRVDKIEKQCDLIQDKYYLEKRRYRDFSTFINTTFTFAMRISYVGAIIYAAILISNGSTLISYGSLLAMIQLIAQIERPFTSLSGLLPKYYQALGSIERIEEYKVHEIKQLKNIDSFEATIDINNVSFGYDDEHILFTDLSFKINPKDIVLIKGRSGVGKTTLLKLIMGMYEAKQGNITYQNEYMSSLSNLFAYVPQENYLIDGSIKDNITLFAKNDVNDDDINNVLEIVCLKDKVASLTKGINTSLYEEGKGFSVGEGQRLSLARALLSDRPIIVLDEFSSAIDEETTRLIFDNLKKLNKTLIIVSHKNTLNDLATQVVELK